MRKRIMGMVLALTMLMGCIPIMAGAETNIQIGEYVQMGTYYEQPILWRCVDIDENGPLMLSDKIICLKPFDMGGTTNSHARDYSWRRLNGSNYWGDSNMRSWLNSTESAGNVQWLCGNPPIELNNPSFYNEYEQEAGFLSNFTASERNVIKEVQQKSLLSNADIELATTGTELYSGDYNYVSDGIANYDTTYAEHVTDKMFLMDIKQVYAVYSNSNILGTNYYMGEPTEQCVANSEYNPSLINGKYQYWLRTPASNSSPQVHLVFHKAGEVSTEHAKSGTIGVRPAFYLDKSVTAVSGNGTSADPYTFDTGEPEMPTATPTINPTMTPTPNPTATPTIIPTATPTPNPTATPVAPSYPYIINGLSLKTTGGAELDDINSIPSGASFMVNTSFTKVQPRNESDYVFVAVYGTEGNLLNLTYVRSNFADNYTYDVGFFIPAQTEPIARIKTFVWDAFSGMTPLAESKEIRNSLEDMQ